jgi:cell division protein FtsB
MLGFYQKRRLRRYIYSKSAVTVLAVIALLVGSAAWNALGKERDARVRKNVAAAELAELEAREELLQREIERLSSERGLEEEIRSKFDVGHEGERIIVVLDTPNKLSEDNIHEEGLWSRISAWFKAL